MKIHPDQIEGVQPGQTQRKDKATQPGNAFGDLLNQEVARGDTPATQGAVPPPIVNPLIAAKAVSGVQRMDANTAQVATQVESILDKWDSYATTLAGSETGLKSAYGTLDSIVNEVATLKAEQSDMAPGLKSIVDELETLTAAEQFKFNRGDYI